MSNRLQSELCQHYLYVFGFRFMFHEPIHIHVIKGSISAKFNVHPEVSLIENNGLKPAELKLVEAVVEENKELIVNFWREYFQQH